MNAYNFLKKELEEAKKEGRDEHIHCILYLLEKHKTKAHQLVKAESRENTYIYSYSGEKKVYCNKLVGHHPKQGYIYEFNCIDCGAKYTEAYQNVRAGKLRCTDCGKKYRYRQISKAHNKNQKPKTKENKLKPKRDTTLLKKLYIPAPEHPSNTWECYSDEEYQQKLEEIKKSKGLNNGDKN